MFLSAKLSLRKCNPSLLMLSTRGIRGRDKLYRTKLPQYKTELGKLPPLTGMLTSPESHQGNEALKDLKMKKFEIYKSYLPVDSNTQLLEALVVQDNDVDQLLRIIHENLNTMTSFYLSVSFEALDDMMRAKTCDPATVAVSPEFRRLCSRALIKMRFFESDEIIKLVKCLATLQIPEKTLIVRATLKMARCLINDFDESEAQTLEENIMAIRQISDYPQRRLRD